MHIQQNKKEKDTLFGQDQEVLIKQRPNPFDYGPNDPAEGPKLLEIGTNKVGEGANPSLSKGNKPYKLLKQEWVCRKIVTRWEQAHPAKQKREKYTFWTRAKQIVAARGAHSARAESVRSRAE